MAVVAKSQICDSLQLERERGTGIIVIVNFFLGHSSSASAECARPVGSIRSARDFALWLPARPR